MSVFHVLCCRPDYFEPIKGDNGYQIEGRKKWLEDPKGWKARLLKTWDDVAHELIKHDATLIKIPPRRHLPDQCFAADVAVMVADGNGTADVVLSCMTSDNRKKEIPLAHKALQSASFLNFRAVKADSGHHEGTGEFIYLYGHNFFAQGYGTRSESGIGWELSAVTNQLVVEVPLSVTPKDGMQGLSSAATKNFHLDTLIMPLPGGRAIACFERMHPATRDFFERLYSKNNRIELDEKEADLFISNGLVVPRSFKQPQRNDWTLFLPDKTPTRILDQIDNWGHRVKLFDVEPSTLSGGGLHCMFNFQLPVNQGRAVALTPQGKPEGYDHLPRDGKASLVDPNASRHARPDTIGYFTHRLTSSGSLRR